QKPRGGHRRDEDFSIPVPAVQRERTLEYTLIVALLREPALASHVLGMETFMGGEGSEAPISEQAIAFITALSSLPVPAEGTAEDEERYNQAVHELLVRHQLPAERLMREAREQHRIGAAQPSRLLSECVRSAELKRQRLRMDALRSREAVEASGDQRLLLAQEKLRERRRQLQKD
ncbi:MAG: hypothetical protein KDD69_20155, partial [Bdellovibrionales bacterium]|nr:hypothetical protein [Bdellovibrionales bacterium]